MGSPLTCENGWISYHAASATFFQVRDEFISIAVNGEREGARAISFQYVSAANMDIVNALAWAMIANAIEPNAYYAYLCSNEVAFCSEPSFSTASDFANNYIYTYHFKFKNEKPNSY